MRVLLSIKPKYAKLIFSREKRYEYRRLIFKDPANIKEVYVYATSPMKKIIGKFLINNVFHDNPEQIWEMTKQYSGIDDKIFFEYFKGRKIAYAIEIGNPIEFSHPINPWEFKANFYPPQSFTYNFQFNQVERMQTGKSEMNAGLSE